MSSDNWKIYPVLTIPLFLGLSSMSAASPGSDEFQSRLNANTAHVSAAQHEYGYAYIARRLFTRILAGKTLGLPDTDLRIIRSAGKPDPQKTIDTLKPYFAEMRELSKFESNTVALADLYQQARRAEQLSDDMFYRGVVSNLSEYGQEIFQKTHSLESTNATFAEIDFLSLAAEEPAHTRSFLLNAISNFENLDLSSTSSAGSSGSSQSSSGGTFTIDEG